MKLSQPFWPRGLLAGALLAAFLIIPAFVVMMFDAAPRTARISSPAKAQFLHARQVNAGGSIAPAPALIKPQP